MEKRHLIPLSRVFLCLRFSVWTMCVYGSEGGMATVGDRWQFFFLFLSDHVEHWLERSSEQKMDFISVYIRRFKVQQAEIWKPFVLFCTDWNRVFELLAEFFSLFFKWNGASADIQKECEAASGNTSFQIKWRDWEELFDRVRRLTFFYCTAGLIDQMKHV